MVSRSCVWQTLLPACGLDNCDRWVFGTNKVSVVWAFRLCGASNPKETVATAWLLEKGHSATVADMRGGGWGDSCICLYMVLQHALTHRFYISKGRESDAKGGYPAVWVFLSKRLIPCQLQDRLCSMTLTSDLSVKHSKRKTDFPRIMQSRGVVRPVFLRGNSSPSLEWHVQFFKHWKLTCKQSMSG